MGRLTTRLVSTFGYLLELATGLIAQARLARIPGDRLLVLATGRGATYRSPTRDACATGAGR